MSENKIPNEQELWDVLDGKAAPEVKPEPKSAKAEPKFAKPDAPKGKIDSFFLTCMAGVAAVAVAATLLVTSLVGGDAPKAPVEKDPQAPVSGETIPAAEGDNALLAALELEKADLRAQVELQKDQIKKLQAELLDLQAASGETPVLPTDPDADAELVNAQVEAYDIFNQIKEAYADFDREKLEQLTPEMDKRLTYLSSDALYEYYLILEYVEMPSNG